MRIIDWGSDVCSSDLGLRRLEGRELGVEASELLFEPRLVGVLARLDLLELVGERFALLVERGLDSVEQAIGRDRRVADRVEREGDAGVGRRVVRRVRSEEHTSELQSLMRISYAVFCLKKKNTTQIILKHRQNTSIKRHKKTN